VIFAALVLMRIPSWAIAASAGFPDLPTGAIGCRLGQQSQGPEKCYSGDTSVNAICSTMGLLLLPGILLARFPDNSHPEACFLLDSKLARKDRACDSAKIFEKAQTRWTKFGPDPDVIFTPMP
jgi:hypothetical protein